MKRSRAPSTLSSTTRAQRRHYQSNQQEESQQSLEVDVGMEDVDLQTVNDSTAVAAAAGRRHYSSRASTGGSSTRSGGRGGSIGVDVDELGAAASASNGSSNGSSSTTSKSRRGRGAGALKEEAGDGAVTAPASVSITNGKAKANEASAGGGSMAATEGDNDGNPPPKKKKKYIRNPETHKEYRARMEAELAQARKMLEEGNAAMVELARDYKRQQALIEQYRAQDNSLVSVSQLSQLQNSQQSQLQNSQQLQLQHSQQSQQLQQGVQDCGGVSGVGAAPAAGPDGVLGLSQDSVEKDAEANNHQFSQDNIPSQPSIFSLSLFGPDDPLLDEPLSQVNQWMAALKDSQEAWNVDDLQLSDGTGADGENGNTDVPDEDFPGPDSIEAMALAAEALSPSKQGNSPPPNSPLASLEMSPAPRAPPAPLISCRGGKKILGKYPRIYDAASRATAMATAAPEVVRVGIACIVSNPNQPGCVLIGKRKGSLGAGTLGLPGGHLEIGEEWATCAKREVREETGLNVKTPTLSWVTNSPKMEGGKHYVTIFMIAEVEDTRMCPTVMEPNKCEGWSWEPWGSLGSRAFPGVPLFKPLVDLKRTTYNPFRVL